MKFLIVLLVVVAVLWLLGAPGRRLRGRDDGRRAAPPAPPPPPPPLQDRMVACPQCGLHLPRSEALPGRGGYFCGEAHRNAYEHAHPPA